MESFVIDKHGPDGPNITSSLSENLLDEVKSLSMNKINQSEDTAIFRLNQLSQNSALAVPMADANDQQISVCEDINDRIGPIRYLLKAAKHQHANMMRISEEKLKEKEKEKEREKEKDSK